MTADEINEMRLWLGVAQKLLDAIKEASAVLNEAVLSIGETVKSAGN